MQPLADRVLIKVEETADVTVGGVVLPEAAKERPLMGKIETITPSFLSPSHPLLLSLASNAMLAILSL
jgi:co-chaperonin GroES (HSP10)